jgi:signal transduction histidine kinase
VLQSPSFGLNRFLLLSLNLGVIAALLGYLGAYQSRLQGEITRLALWPRRVPREAKDLIAEILVGAAEILEAPRVVLVWEDMSEAQVNVAWQQGDRVQWSIEREGSYGTFVIPGLEHRSFQAKDATRADGDIVYWSEGRFRDRRGRPVNEALRARFSMQSVASWSLEGELVRGRLFCLDKQPMRLDDLIVGELVARLAVSRLDGLYLLAHLRQSAAYEERLRVARDIHDSLLQSVAGTAMHLVAARRLLDTDPAAARRRLEQVQTDLERSELEVRSFIQRLRPSTRSASDAVEVGLAQRLEELRQRVEAQWEIKVSLSVDNASGRVPAALDEEVYRIVQEAMLNAARHADASLIRVAVAARDASLEVAVADDGTGFPFQGTYNLAALTEMDRGPLTLKERVAELHGDLTLRSSESGTELLITLPFAAAP